MSRFGFLRSGTRWPNAIVAMIMISLCVTMVVLADSENAQHVAEAVREGVSSVTQQGTQKLQGLNAIPKDVPQLRSHAYAHNYE